MRWLRVIPKSCANVLWSALSSCARLALHLVSADSSQRAGAQQLREEFARIPLKVGEEKAVRGSWQSNRLRLRKEVLKRDPRAFLTWDVIRETMFPPPYAGFARRELNFLKRQDWAVWRRVIKERPIGMPCPSVFYPLSSANAIHHAYHLCRFEGETGLSIREFGTVVEFGGGYGSLCRIVHGLGFAGKYAIFDLPEQLALQRYYLAALNLRNVLAISEIELLGSVAETSRKPMLFVATWSLSESPLGLRRQVAQSVGRFDAFLIAYQSEFGGIDNVAFFREWESWFPEVRWMRRTIEHVPASTYLFGVRKR